MLNQRQEPRSLEASNVFNLLDHTLFAHHSSTACCCHDYINSSRVVVGIGIIRFQADYRIEVLDATLVLTEIFVTHPFSIKDQSRETYGIPRLQPGEECAVTRGRSRYYREPAAPAGGGSTSDRKQL